MIDAVEHRYIRHFVLSGAPHVGRLAQRLSIARPPLSQQIDARDDRSVLVLNRELKWIFRVRESEPDLLRGWCKANVLECVIRHQQTNA
ncbi:MAG: hypothetical protein WDN30_03530 [Pararobbsia sp.]